MYGFAQTVGSFNDAVLYEMGTLEMGLIKSTWMTARPPTDPMRMSSSYASQSASPSGAASFAGACVNDTASMAARHCASVRCAMGIATDADPPNRIKPTLDVVSENKQYAALRYVRIVESRATSLMLD